MMKKLYSRELWIAPVLSISLFGAGCDPAGSGATAETSESLDYLRHRVTTVTEYENFSDAASYGTRWFDVSSFLSIGEPAIANGKNFTNGSLNIGTPAFATTYDLVYDHMKYFAASTQSFDIPVAGSIKASATITAQTPNAVPGRLNPATGRRLREGQQGAATFSLLEVDTGVHLSWWVSGNKAFALYERLMPEGQCTLNTAYTQIIGEVNISSGSHRYAIEYRRQGSPANAPDHVRFKVDGRERFSVQNVGRPLDRQGRPHALYPSQGPGEILKNQLNAFVVGHGIGTMVDEFPFNQCPTGQVSVPASQRAFGQGVTATFDNIKVKTIRPSSSPPGNCGPRGSHNGHCCSRDGEHDDEDENDD